MSTFWHFSNEAGICSRFSTHTHTTVLQPSWNLSMTTRVSQYQKGKTNLDLLEQEIVSGSGIIWDICKSAPWPRHMTMPASHHSVFFTSQMPFLPPNQQCQSTEGTRIFLYLQCLMLLVGQQEGHAVCKKLSGGIFHLFLDSVSILKDVVPVSIFWSYFCHWLWWI